MPSKRLTLASIKLANMEKLATRFYVMQITYKLQGMPYSEPIIEAYKHISNIAQLELSTPDYYKEKQKGEGK